MEMTGEQRIPANRQAVWDALNDPEVLRRCIPGCEELIRHSASEMTAVAVIKVGPISARFQGHVTLGDLDPPNGYRITGEGQGGVAGHARGGALVRLREDGDGTILSYEVSAQVGGKLAQLGGRMIDATARKLADAFFAKFAAEVSGGQTQPETPVVAGTASPVSAARRPAGVGPGHWLYGAAGVVLGWVIVLLCPEQFVANERGLVVLAGMVGFLVGRLAGPQQVTVIVDRN